MAKPNVYTAGRDELLGLGLRTGIVDEIIQRRRRKGGVDLAALTEIPGVGPATSARLRNALDFEQPDRAAATKSKPKREPSGAPVEPPAAQGADVADAALQAGTEQAAELVAAATSGDVDMAGRAPDIVHDVIEAGGLTSAGEEASAAAEPQAGEADAQQAQVLTLELGAQVAFARMFAEVLREQAEENAEAMAALSQAKNLTDVLRLQGGYLRHTLERMSNLNRQWLELSAKT